MKHRLARWIAALWLGLSAPALASQATLVTPGAPLPMTGLASFLNAAFLSIGSCNSGNSAPANGIGAAAFAGECWINTTSNPWVFSYTPDATHWVEFGTLNTSTFVWTSYTNGIPLTTGTSGATIPLNNGGFTQSGTVNFTGTFEISGTTETFPGSGILVGTTDTQTLTNKTLTSSTDVLGGVTMTLGSDATGDIYYRNAGGQLTRLALGSGSQVLGVNSGLPAWVAASSAASITVGSTAVNSGTTGDILFNNAGTLGNETIATALGSRTTLPTISAVTGSAHSGGFGTNGSGTYTTPSNVLWFEVWMVGGGSGGGGGNSGTLSTGGGNTCWNNSGAACTSPTFTAGGAAGSSDAATGAGGTLAGSVGCDGFSSAGAQGSGGVQSLSSFNGTGGVGAASFFGGGGFGGFNTAGGAANAPGAGGGGGAQTAATAQASGYGGSSGALCHFIITSPAGTYTYAVGTGGTHAAGGTSGDAGGDGAGGEIYVVEHYGSWLLNRDLDPVANDNSPAFLSVAA